MQKHYNYLNIDLDKKIHTKLKAKQGDSKSRYILVNLISNSTYYNLTGTTVKIYGIKKDKTIFFNHATVTNAKQGQFEIELTNQALAVPGEIEIQILILGTNEEKLTTFSFFINVEKTIIDDTAIESTNEFTALTEALSSVQNIDNRFNEVNEQFNTIGDEVEYLAYNITNKPLIFYVETTGSENNNGLTKETAFNKISTALKKIPKNIFNDVIIKVGEGVFNENDMLDEWGRKVGLNIDGLSVNCERTSVDTVIDGITFEENKKRSKLFIKGSGIDSTIIQGDGVSRVGIKSRLRDFYIESLTIQGYKTGITAHEGGAISGYSIKIKDFVTQAILCESQQSKIEIGNLQLENTNLATNLIYGINGQINISSSNFSNLSSSYMFILDNCIINLVSCTLSKGIGAGLGFVSRNSLLEFDSCVFDGLENRLLSGDCNVNNSIFKNCTTKAIENRNGYLFLKNTNMFNNNICIEQYNGYINAQNLKSLDGDVQSYNKKGIVVYGGYCGISPYSITNLGVDLKGEQDKPYTDYIIKSNYIKLPSINFDKSSYSSSGYTAQELTLSIRNLKNNSVNTTTIPNTLYFILRGVTNPTSYHVVDAYSQLQKVVNALVEYGIFSSNQGFTIENVTNNSDSFLKVQQKFNKLIEKLENIGLLECNGDII